MLTKRDLMLIVVLGTAVGLLIQPIISNNANGISRYVEVGTARIVIFFGILLLAPLALFVASLIGKFVPVLYQFAKFAAVGVLNTMVDLGAFNVLYLFNGSYPAGVTFSIFKGISFLCATTNSFFWNKFWTFGSRETVNTGETIKFYSVAMVGGFINIGIATFVFQHPAASVSPNTWGSLVSPISGILTAFLWDFLGYKYFVFKKAQL